MGRVSSTFAACFQTLSVFLKCFLLPKSGVFVATATDLAPVQEETGNGLQNYRIVPEISKTLDRIPLAPHKIRLHSVRVLESNVLVIWEMFYLELSGAF